MAYEQKPNSGALFVNDRKQTETHPDMTGKLNVDGKDYYVSAWQKQSSKGAFYSLSVKPKDDVRSAPSQIPERFDDEVGF